MLTPAALEKIDREIAKYPPERRQSAVMAALIVAPGATSGSSVPRCMRSATRRNLRPSAPRGGGMVWRSARITLRPNS